MRALARLPAHGPLVALLLVALAASAHAQGAAPADSGLFLIYDKSVPVAHEHYKYEAMGDSTIISAKIERQLADEHGVRHAFTKAMVLVVDSRDYGLLRYNSSLDFNGHTRTCGLLPTDTVMTCYRESETGGFADRIVQPPGRLFVLDPQLFTLFDVLCRSLAGKTFASRHVQLVSLAPDTLTMPVATISVVASDTLRLGPRRVPTRHYALVDGEVRFELWADASGHLLRMTHEPSGLSVEQVVETARPVAGPPKRRAPTVRR